jgi:hypothetical protein
MKLFEKEVQFEHPWDRVTLASWRKYPNDNSQHVLHVDILSREVCPKTGVLKTERLITCKQNVPSIIEWVRRKKERYYLLFINYTFFNYLVSYIYIYFLLNVLESKN